MALIDTLSNLPYEERELLRGLCERGDYLAEQLGALEDKAIESGVMEMYEVDTYNALLSSYIRTVEALHGSLPKDRV